MSDSPSAAGSSSKDGTQPSASSLSKDLESPITPTVALSTSSTGTTAPTDAASALTPKRSEPTEPVVPVRRQLVDEGTDLDDEPSTTADERTTVQTKDPVLQSKGPKTKVLLPIKMVWDKMAELLVSTLSMNIELPPIGRVPFRISLRDSPTGKASRPN